MLGNCSKNYVSPIWKSLPNIIQHILKIFYIVFYMIDITLRFKQCQNAFRHYGYL